MADVVLFCVVTAIPSILALMAVDSLAGWFPAFRPNDHLLASVGSHVEMPEERGAKHTAFNHRGHGAHGGLEVPAHTMIEGADPEGIGGRRAREAEVVAGFNAQGGEPAARSMAPGGR